MAPFILADRPAIIEGPLSPDKLAAKTPKSPMIDNALAWLAAEIAPRAEAIDRDPEALAAALDALAERELLALRRPREFGGPELGPEDFSRYQEGIARASGALAFLQTQHQSAVAMIAAGPNEELKRRLLPKMADGERRVGIGFGHLRRPGAPPVTARKNGAGYLFDGEVPWVTGRGYFDAFLGAAPLPDGSAVFALLPFEDGARIRPGPPEALAVMEVTRTVSIRLDAVEVPQGDVVIVHEPGWLAAADALSIRSRAHLAIGCSRAGLDVLERAAHRGADVVEATAALSEEWRRCRAAARGHDLSVSDLEARSWALALAVRVGHAAVAACSGAALKRDHPAQRILREALAYTVLGQSAAVRGATLRRLAEG